MVTTHANRFTFRMLQVLLLSAGSARSADGPVFTDVTGPSGIEFHHTFGDRKMSNIVEATGSGCMFFDYNNDGWMDIYAVNGCYHSVVNDTASAVKGKHPTNRLFRNDGDGTFTDATESAGVGDPGYGMACVAGDYDNDGDADMYVTNYGRNTLYRNDGDGTFTDVTEAAGVGDSLWGVGTVFLDYDNDGFLDLYVGNYLEFDPEYRLYYEADEFPGPLSYPGQEDILYRNNGDGSFTDVTKRAGVRNRGRAMGVLSSDYNNDGHVDLFVANDAMENYLYRNNGNGTFTDVGLEAGVAFSAHGDASSSMGGDFGDFDRDGDLDLLVPDMTFNSCYRNLGKGLCKDASAELGVGELSGQYWSWGGDLFDYDNDGDLDLFICNGDGHRLDTQEEIFMENIVTKEGAHVFRDAAGSAGVFFRHKSVSRGMAVGDYDNDGDMDVFILNLDQPSVLLRNDGGNRRSWIMVRPRGTVSNRDGLGARVTVTTGRITQVEEKKSATSYLSQNDPRLHFGLNKAGRVDMIRVRWPSGHVQQRRRIKAGRVVTIAEERAESKRKGK